MKPLRALLAALLALTLSACAGLAGGDPPRVNVVGVEPLTGQGLELRMLVKLRVINPNDTAIDYDGVFIDMEVQGKNFASGVSDAKGSIPRFGEAVLSVPVTISALALLRQGMDMAQGKPAQVAYEVNGKLAGPQLRALRFSAEGEIKLPAGLTP
jgi:LEA14-like dessication related protein